MSGLGRGLLVGLFLLLTAACGGKPATRKFKPVPSSQGAGREAATPSRKHRSHEHGHGAHPHSIGAHHHHAHPHPHLSGADGHHHP